MTYDFQEQKYIGVADEQTILKYLAPNWEIEQAGLEDQKRGIDYWLRNKQGGRRRSIEIKSDRTATRTGNAFIEIYSDYPKKLGWAQTCQAQYILYFLPDDRLIYVISPTQIRCHLKQWSEVYPVRRIQNPSWITVGHLVPLKELEEIAQQIINL